jgi:hypothetical protein
LGNNSDKRERAPPNPLPADLARLCYSWLVPKRARFYFGGGSAVILFLLEILQVMQIVSIPLSVAALLGVIAVSFYAVGIWEWVGQFKYAQQSVNDQQVLRLRGLVTGLFVLAAILAFILWHRMYPLPSNEMQATLERYRRALGIDENKGITALIELTDEEVEQKGTLIYKKIRDMNSFYNVNDLKLQNKRDRKEIDEAKYQELVRQQMLQAGDEFIRELRTDAIMVLTALRGRIPYEHRKHIVGLPDIMPADPRAGSVSLYSVTPGVFNLFWSEMLANEIEELVKLLPDR